MQNRFSGTVTSSSPGDSFEIYFSNPDLAGTIVNIVVTNGLNEPYHDALVVRILLDSDGNGVTGFEPPASWGWVICTHETSLDHEVLIQ